MTEPSAMRAALVALVEPVRAEREQLAARIETMETELAEARQALRDVDVVLGRLTGERRQGKPGPKPKPPQGTHHPEEDVAFIRDFIASGNGNLTPEFTGTHVYRALRKSGASIGESRVREAVRTLHKRGVLTAVRRTPGGGTMYSVVGGESVS